MSGTPNKIRGSTRRTFLDLFCGCGGFTLGMTRAGLDCLAAIDLNPEAMTVFRANFSKVSFALEKDLTKFSPTKLSHLLGVTEVDVIVGGPPCQGFSTARQVDGANHGARLIADPRRQLFREFLRYVQFFRPKVFVIENVLGIRTAAGGAYFTRVQSEARSLGYRVHPQIEEAWKLGVPQKRRRQLIFGVRADLPGFFPTQVLPADRAGLNLNVPDDYPTLWDAIGDLPPLLAGSGLDEREYDLKLRSHFLATRGRRAAHYQTYVLEIARSSCLTAHTARPHNEQDLRDFARLREGEHSAEAIARGEAMEFTYNRDIFKDRYKRQHREELCSTIVAHLSKDGLMFVHPTQERSLTPREAARVQSFPDWFRFPVARTHQFRIIGNAVPPLVAEAVGAEINEFLDYAIIMNETLNFGLPSLPSDEISALSVLTPLLDKDRRALRRISADDFKRAWYAVAFLYAGLHPDSALDHGKAVCRKSEADYPVISRVEPRLLAPYYDRSGWPIILAPVAEEAWRRYEEGELKDEEFYCSEAQMAGICHRNPDLANEVSRYRGEGAIA